MSGGCWKRRYASLDEAESVLLRAKIARALGRRYASQRREQRVYACRNCGGWHLTSQTGKYSAPREEAS